MLVLQLPFRLVVDLHSSRGFHHGGEYGEGRAIYPYCPSPSVFVQGVERFHGATGKLTQTYGPWLIVALFRAYFP